MANPLNQYSPMQSALALLQPTTSYAQKRADADRNLMLQSALTQQAQQQTEVARQQALLAQQQQAQLMNVPFLERDDREWKIYTDGMRKKIRDRVENDFGGDYEQYAKTMLDQDIQGMALEAQRSPLYKGALERRNNYLQAAKDSQEGKIHRSVSYRLTNGQQKTAPWEQAYLDFSNGVTEELPYSGGFKVDGKWRKIISDQYSPRVGTLGKFRPDAATPQEIASALVTGEGLTGSDAMEYLRRTGSMLPPIYYKFDPRDPYREEQLRQGWANIGLSKERNSIARQRNEIAKKASAGQIDLWDATFNNPDNIITRKNGAPATVNASIFDENMQSAGSGKLQGFTGKVAGPALLEATGAVYNKKTGMYQGAGGEAFVSVKNNAGGVDLRKTDLTGLSYQTKPGNIYRYETPPTAYEASTGRKPYRYMQEQTIIISSDEAKKARAGGLFRGVFNIGNDYSSGYNLFGNADTPTGKGAYTKIQRDGKTYYQFRVLQPVEPTMLDRQQATWSNMNTQTKTGQAVLNDADDDLSYY